MAASTPLYALPYPQLADAPNVAQDIQNLAQAVETLLTPTAYTNLTMQNSWVAGTGSFLPSVKKYFGSLAHLRGALTPPGSSNAANTVIALLPSGHLPQITLRLLAISSAGVTVPLQIDAATGQITLYGAAYNSGTTISINHMFPLA